MDGFVDLVTDLLCQSGLKEVCVHRKQKIELPGYFRAEKQWDLIVVVDGFLLAAIEFKSQIGPSFGNNFNNRSEEAIGSAKDFRVAYREGAFQLSPDPWLGYVMLLEDCERSQKAVTPKESHFGVFPEFRNASYAKRYELLLLRLVRERLYDSACLLLSQREGGYSGDFSEPSPELRFQNFAASLIARSIAYKGSRR